MVLESETIALQAITEQGAEGINAFLEKRKPDYSRVRDSQGRDNRGSSNGGTDET
jgi:1,4-dihydroxy-2-naphthoyl-CoA synthase